MAGQIDRRQLKNEIIDDSKVAANAAIATSKLADGSKIVVRENDGTINAANERVSNLAAPTSPNDAVRLTDIDDLESDKNFFHVQNTPSAIWTITHNLGKYPSIEVFDSAGSQVEGTVTFINANSITIQFSAAFSGKATLN